MSRRKHSKKLKRMLVFNNKHKHGLTKYEYEMFMSRFNTVKEGNIFVISKFVKINN